MKTLTIKQPWASLIANGIKDIENRTWKTNHRGKIYIHAAQINSKDWEDLINLPDNQRNEFFEFVKHKILNTKSNSSIIGEVEIVDCVQDSKSIWALPNHYHWVLKNAIIYDEPILNVKGKLSLWEYTGAVGGN
jgi:hypothetical protein